MLILGLTGSIGTGKTATGRMFATHGCRVHDADAAVHALYAPGGAAAAPVEAAFPGVAVDDGIDRAKLSQQVVGRPEAIARLEAIVHPLVAAARDEFLAAARDARARVAVLEVPLLFETGGERACDVVVVTSAPAEVQRERVLARPGMSEEKLAALCARQLDEAEKRRRAHFIVETQYGFAAAERQVVDILRALAPLHGRRG